MNEKMEPKNVGEEEIKYEESPKQEIPAEQRETERAEAEDLKRRLDFLKEKNRFMINDKITAFVNALRKTYGIDRIRDYALFHILVGSTYDGNDCEFFDFYEEKDSIKKFIERLEGEQKEAKK
ncbi:MAG: hypothetical protein WC582_00555 [Patescibacteria group bacterium]|jgi:hypothetical protein